MFRVQGLGLNCIRKRLLATRPDKVLGPTAVRPQCAAAREHNHLDIWAGPAYPADGDISHGAATNRGDTKDLRQTPASLGGNKMQVHVHSQSPADMVLGSPPTCLLGGFR